MIATHTVVLATGVSYRRARRRRGSTTWSAAGLLRFGRDRGRRVRRRARPHRRRRQLGRAGRGVLRPARRPGDAGGARRRPRALDVALPGRADPRDRQHRRCGSTPRSPSVTAPITCECVTLVDTPTADSRGRCRAPVRLHRRRAADRLAAGRDRPDAGGFVLTGPDLSPSGSAPPAGTLERTPYLLESSVPGVFVAGDVRPPRSSGSPRRSARARWPSPLSTATWPSSERV